MKQRETIIAFLWWLDSYWERGFRRNEDDEMEPYWSSKKEGSELWDMNDAKLYSSSDLADMFLKEMPKKPSEMTKDQFLNSWSMELSMSCSLSSIESKKFLHAFYEKVVGFEKSLQPEITDIENKAKAFIIDISDPDDSDSSKVKIFDMLISFYDYISNP